MLRGPLRLNFWRAPIDNDRGNGMPDRHRVWRSAGDEARVEAKSEAMEENFARLNYDLKLPAGESTARLEYEVHADGVIDVRVAVDPRGANLPSLPRVGMQCQVAKALDKWSWYGRGPWENYRDRNSGAILGIHSGRIADLWHGYAKTQENSNRTDVRWTEFRASSGGGLRFESTDDQPLEVGCYPFAEADLDGERRAVDVPERDYLTVHISHAQMGVGGEDSWGARTLPQYQLPAGKIYRYAFRISAFSDNATSN